MGRGAALSAPYPAARAGRRFAQYGLAIVVLSPTSGSYGGGGGKAGAGAAVGGGRSVGGATS